MSCHAVWLSPRNRGPQGHEQANDAITRTAIDVLGNSRLQSDPYVMRGLQDLIPGRRTDVTISDSGKKVNMSLAQARKQLKKGSKKSPPEPMPISSPLLQLCEQCGQSYLAQWTQLRANVTASGGEEHDSSGGGNSSGSVDGHNGRKGPKEGTGHILERVFERVFTGDKDDCGKGSYTACTQRSCLHVCR